MPFKDDAIGAQTERPRDGYFRSIAKGYQGGAAACAVSGSPNQKHMPHCFHA